MSTGPDAHRAHPRGPATRAARPTGTDNTFTSRARTHSPTGECTSSARRPSNRATAGRVTGRSGAGGRRDGGEAGHPAVERGEHPRAVGGHGHRVLPVRRLPPVDGHHGPVVVELADLRAAEHGHRLDGE